MSRSPRAAPAAGHEVDAAVRASVGAAGRPVVLAVSGGADSMALLRSAARVAPAAVAAVACFDHGTGQWAGDAQALVRREAARLGLVFVGGRAAHPLSGEAAWRAARWAFLGRVARAHGAAVATAHSRDDQVETVVMRLLRGAGARGLAGLAAPSAVLRPLLGLARGALRAYAAAGGPFVDDPANDDGRHLRVRVRREILPALRRAAPALEGELLALAGRAARWRRELDALVDGFGLDLAGDELRVPAAALAGLAADELAVVWPAAAARAGLVLDRRGTARLAGFTTTGRPGQRVQLAGGWEVLRRTGGFVVRRWRSDVASRPSGAAAPGGGRHGA